MKNFVCSNAFLETTPLVYCCFELMKKKLLFQFARTHTGVKPFKCECCAISFSQLSHLNRHKKTLKCVLQSASQA